MNLDHAHPGTGCHFRSVDLVLPRYLHRLSLISSPHFLCKTSHASFLAQVGSCNLLRAFSRAICSSSSLEHFAAQVLSPSLLCVLSCHCAARVPPCDVLCASARAIWFARSLVQFAALCLAQLCCACACSARALVCLALRRLYSALGMCPRASCSACALGMCSRVSCFACALVHPTVQVLLCILLGTRTCASCFACPFVYFAARSG